MKLELGFKAGGIQASKQNEGWPWASLILQISGRHVTDMQIPRPLSGRFKGPRCVVSRWSSVTSSLHGWPQLEDPQAVSHIEGVRWQAENSPIRYPLSEPVNLLPEMAKKTWQMWIHYGLCREILLDYLVNSKGNPNRPCRRKAGGSESKKECDDGQQAQREKCKDGGRGRSGAL